MEGDEGAGGWLWGQNGAGIQGGLGAEGQQGV